MPPYRSVVIRTEHSAVAPKSSSPSRAVKAAISVLRGEGAKRACEIGCGLLANTPHFLRAFRNVILIDTKAQYKRIKEQLSVLDRNYSSYDGFIEAESFAVRRLGLDAAIIINVIHVLPSIAERIRLLANTARNLRRDGLAFIDVPRNEAYYRDFVKTATPYRDGHIMRRDGYYTFYKNLHFNEVQRYLEAVELEIVQRIYIDHRTTVLAAKRASKA